MGLDDNNYMQHFIMLREFPRNTRGSFYSRNRRDSTRNYFFFLYDIYHAQRRNCGYAVVVFHVDNALDRLHSYKDSHALTAEGKYFVNYSDQITNC